MPPVNATIQFDPADYARLKAAFARMSNWQALDMGAPLRVAGEKMLAEFRASFAAQASPAGEPWAPLSERTQLRYLYKRKRRAVTAQTKRRRRRTTRRRRGPEHILQARRVPGWLLRRLSMRVESFPARLVVGEFHAGPTGYRAEFGDAAINDPARPFVQLTPGNQHMLAELLLAHLESKWF